MHLRKILNQFEFERIKWNTCTWYVLILFSLSIEELPLKLSNNNILQLNKWLIYSRIVYQNWP